MSRDSTKLKLRATSRCDSTSKINESQQTVDSQISKVQKEFIESNSLKNPYANVDGGTMDSSSQGLKFRKNKKHILNLKHLSKQRKLRAEQSGVNLDFDPSIQPDSRIPQKFNFKGEEPIKNSIKQNLSLHEINENFKQKLEKNST